MTQIDIEDVCGKGVAVRGKQYTPEFEFVWENRPRRDGGDPKGKAFKAWSARIKSGHEPRAIAQGVLRYRRWCESAGKIGTEFVMQLATFLGPDEHFTNDWAVKRPASDDPAPSTKTKDRTVSQQLADRSWAY